MEPERAEEYQSTGSFPLPHTLLLLLVLPVNRASREAPGARPLLPEQAEEYQELIHLLRRYKRAPVPKISPEDPAAGSGPPAGLSATMMNAVAAAASSGQAFSPTRSPPISSREVSPVRQLASPGHTGQGTGLVHVENIEMLRVNVEVADECPRLGAHLMTTALRCRYPTTPPFHRSAPFHSQHFINFHHHQHLFLFFISMTIVLPSLALQVEVAGFLKRTSTMRRSSIKHQLTSPVPQTTTAAIYITIPPLFGPACSDVTAHPLVSSEVPACPGAGVHHGALRGFLGTEVGAHLECGLSPQNSGAKYPTLNYFAIASLILSHSTLLPSAGTAVATHLGAELDCCRH
eukprot:1161221-Pelagomonas_calceolata.AAC.2